MLKIYKNLYKYNWIIVFLSNKYYFKKIYKFFIIKLIYLINNISYICKKIEIKKNISKFIKD